VLHPFPASSPKFGFRAATADEEKSQHNRDSTLTISSSVLFVSAIIPFLLLCLTLRILEGLHPFSVWNSVALFRRFFIGRVFFSCWERRLESFSGHILRHVSHHVLVLELPFFYLLSSSL